MAKLQYGSLLNIGITKAGRQRIQKMQNRALRICLLMDRYTSNLTLHKEAKVIPIHLRSKLEMHKLMFHISRKNLPSSDNSVSY